MSAFHPCGHKHIAEGCGRPVYSTTNLDHATPSDPPLRFAGADGEQVDPLRRLGRMARLKLFKLTSGFHDSYVAAASRAAALKAWGARTDLFAMGAAEQVDDPATLAKAAKKPGVVLQKRRTKGSKLETPEPRKTARHELAKAKRDCDVIARRLARAETARDSELKKLDMTIKRLAAKRQAAEAKHIQFIEGLKEDLQRAGAKLDF